MGRKVVFVMIDGLADVSNASEGTYLQIAQVPTLDSLASAGVCGLIDPVETGLACGSDTAHMAIFKYNPLKYYQGRGSFETLGAGLDLECSDIAFKCNFATIDPLTNTVTKRRVSRTFYQWGLELCKVIESFEVPGYPGYTVRILHATEHRCGLKISGTGLSHYIEGTDPLKDHLPLAAPRALDLENSAAVFTAELVRAVSDWIHQQLAVHPINKQREAEGKSPANVLLLRGCGVRLQVPSFLSKHGMRCFFISPTAIIKGLGLTIGAEIIEVPGTTGDVYSNHKEKFKYALKKLPEYDMGFIHIKAVDDLGHDKDTMGRVNLIEKLDSYIRDFLYELMEMLEDAVVVLTGDHTTQTHIGDHSYEPVPFMATYLSSYRQLLRGGTAGVVSDSVMEFNEIECSRGALGRFPGKEVMKLIKQLRDFT